MDEGLNDEVIDAIWCGAVRSSDIAKRVGRGEVEVCEALDHLSAAGLVVRHSEEVGEPHWELVRPQS